MQQWQGVGSEGSGHRFAGFIGGYVVEELLGQGYEVVGIDNYSKYGPVTTPTTTIRGYRLVEGDAETSTS